MALACSAGLVACGDDKANAPIDLDGDGMISSWETFFDTSSAGTSGGGTIIAAPENIVYISNAEQLLAINNTTDPKTYVLSSNIDLGGAEVCINLSGSSLYGRGYEIKNFKLGKVNDELTSNLYSDDNYSSKNIRCLFYGGVEVYGVNLFAGVQNLDINTSDNRSYNSLSMFFNTTKIEGVNVKGLWSINPQKNDGRSLGQVDAGLIYSGMSTEKMIGEQESVVVDNVVTIANCSVDGAIIINDKYGTHMGANIGYIASKILKDSTIYHCSVKGNIKGVNSYNYTNIGGVVGYNRGFVSSVNFAGDINLTTTCDTGVTQTSARECVGGIVGNNDVLGEIKNCVSSGTISIKNTEIEEEIAQSGSMFLVGGIAGFNNGGIFEMCTTDANIVCDNMRSTMYVGGFCGKSDRGLMSYGICRGNITLNNILDVSVAQIAGHVFNGYIEKVVATTGITINNTNEELTTSKIDVGMAIVFDEVLDAPLMSRVLIDGITTVTCPAHNNSAVNYLHGLRHNFQVLVGQDEETGEDIYQPIVPAIFDNIYKSDGYRFNKRNVQNGSVEKEPVTINFISDIGDSVNENRFLIDKLDFKNYLNHNEVSMGTILSYNALAFTIDSKVASQSFFGESKYNGELAYFDHEFNDYYNHIKSALGYCEHDRQDELMSFVYELISSNKGKNTSNYAIKFDDNFINYVYDPEAEDLFEGLPTRPYLFRERLTNVFTCLNIKPSPTLKMLDKMGIDVENSEGGNVEVKFLQYTFADSNNEYVMTVDISNLMADGEDVSELFVDEYVVYLSFKITSKIA